MVEHLDVESASTAVAPDGSTVEILLARGEFSTARFVFPAQSVSVAVRHRTVTEVWHILAGRGRFWSSAGPADGFEIGPGSSIALEPGETFQVRSTTDEALVAFGVTTPVWPGPGEAELADGRWEPTLQPGPR